ncbi:MAG: aldo/keto reductase [Alphaproteobacteria bacterium]
MKYIDFQDGRIPALGFGTFDIRGEDCVRATATALKIGYRHIDTAQEYDNEIEVGQAINGADIDRGEIFLTTKIWPNRIGKGDLRRAADESLERLATDYIDLLLIHWPSPTISLAESLEALAEVKAAGKAKYIGISNFPITLMHEAVEMHGAGVVCNQVEYHPFLDQRRLIDAARAHGLFVTAYCPLAQGEIDGDPTLGAIARKHGKTPAQVTLRWLLDQDGVAAIPKAASEAHCRANFEIFDFALSEEERLAIDGLRGAHRLVSPEFAPEWDTP